MDWFERLTGFREESYEGRQPILLDVAHTIFLKGAKFFSGNFLIDDTYLFENGVRDFDRYRVDGQRRSRPPAFRIQAKELE